MIVGCAVDPARLEDQLTKIVVTAKQLFDAAAGPRLSPSVYRYRDGEYSRVTAPSGDGISLTVPDALSGLAEDR